MNTFLHSLPTMLEAKSMAEFVGIRKRYNESLPASHPGSEAAFWVLRSKEGDLLAYFYDSNKTPSPTLKETVQWMQDTDNTAFPGNVSLEQGIKARYDAKFHAELSVAIEEVYDEFLEQHKRFRESDLINRITNDPELMAAIEKLADLLPDEPPVRIK